jgi:hypothetical protein
MRHGISFCGAGAPDDIIAARTAISQGEVGALRPSVTTLVATRDAVT